MITIDSSVSSVGSSSSLLCSVNLTVVDGEGSSVQTLSLFLNKFSKKNKGVRIIIIPRSYCT